MDKNLIEYLLYLLRQTVGIAKEARRKRYGDDLFDYSIKSSERLIMEIENELKK